MVPVLPFRSGYNEIRLVVALNMSRPVAKQGDRVVALDTHLVIPETGGAPVVVQIPFDGALDSNLSPTVLSG